MWLGNKTGGWVVLYYDTIQSWLARKKEASLSFLPVDEKPLYWIALAVWRELVKHDVIWVEYTSQVICSAPVMHKFTNVECIV